MPDRVLTAEMILSGKDAGVSDMLAKIANNIDKVAKQAAHTEQVQALGKSLVGLDKQMQAIDKMAQAQSGLTAMQERAARAAAGVDKLRTEIAAVEKPTAAMTRALSSAETAAEKATAAVGRQAEALARAEKIATGMGLSTGNVVREQERLAKAFTDTARQAEIAMTAERKMAEAEKAAARAAHGATRGHGGGGHGGFDLGGAVAGVVAAHSYIGAMESVFHVGREFDKERRYGKVVMGISDEEQKPLIDQAIHGGATSRYNDIQWLESQRELAMRGYNKDQVLGFTPIAAQIGQAFDVSMPEAVKALEGAMLGFGKDVSTFEKAQAAATRTADLEVKASKISGMGFEDIVQLYKYAASPSKMAGLSEENMLAYGAISKKSNMGGDESGVAFRALMANMLKPTAGAKTAMLANGIDYSKYQSAPHAIDLNAFGRDVATKYGVRLDKETREALQKIFNDKATVDDPAKFAIAVTNALRNTLGGDDAKSLKAIAKDAGAFRDASTGKVDVNGLMSAIMEAIHKSPQLANAIFGSKQGGRIYAALGDPEFYKKILEELHSESEGYAKKVSEDRMKGFDGAVSKLEGSVMNFKSAIYRAIDNGGSGEGMLTITHATEMLGEFTQHLAEADPKILEFGTVVAGAGAMFGAVKLAGWFTGAAALKGSAVALDEAAAALEAAAVRLGASGVAGGAGGAVNAAEDAAGGAAGSLGMFGRFLAMGSIAGAGIFVGDAMLNRRDSSKALVDGGRPDPLTVNDNNTMLPGMDSGTLSDNAEAAKRAADAARDAGTAAVGAWDWIKSTAKGFGFGDRLPVEVPFVVPLPPERPSGYTGRGEDGNALHNNRTDETPAAALTRALAPIVPPPEVVEGFRLLPPAAHGAADALDRMKDRENQLKDSFGLTGFVMGKLDESAARAALALASLGSIGGGGGSVGGGGGIIQAAYHPDVGGFGGGGHGGAMTPLLRGALPRSASGVSHASAGGDGGPNPYADGPGGGTFVPPVGDHLTAGMRNNNLGNIGWFGQHTPGLLGPSNARDVDHSIGKFATQEDGIRAAAALALRKYRGGRHSAWDLIAAAGGWTPGALGPGASVNVARAMGLGNRDDLHLDQPDRMVKFLHGLAIQEHGPAGRFYDEGRIRGALGGKEHPALAAPPLKPRVAPAEQEAPAHLITARLEAKMERMVAAVERGGLHRIQIEPHRSLVAKKTYQRGSVGSTIA